MRLCRVDLPIMLHRYTDVNQHVRYG